MAPDPILIKAARQLRTAQERATKAGVTLSPEDLDAFMRDETKGKYTFAHAQKLLSSVDTGISVRNLGRSFMQGASMNFGDEIMGALPSWLGGGEGAKEEMRLKEEMFRKEHPYADGAAGITGAVAPTLLAPEVEALSAGGAMLKGAVTGGTVGLLSGAGAGEDTKDRATRAAIGTAVGAGLGGVLPGLVSGVKYLRSPATRASARLAHAIEQSGGPDAVRKSVAAQAAAGRGDDVMLADASDHLRSAADFSANNSDEALIPLAGAVRSRQRNMAGRLLDDVRAHLPGGDADAGAAQETLEQSRKAWAKGPNGYGGLRDGAPQIDAKSFVKGFGHIIDQEPVKAALNEARRTGLIGLDLDKAQPLSYQMAQDAYERIADAASAAFRQGKGNLGSRLADVHDEIGKFLETSVPGWRAVNNEYAGRMRLERALDAGQKAWEVEDSRALSREFAKLAPEEQQQYRLGMASQLLTKLRGASTNRDEATRLVNMSKAQEDKMNVIFGSKDTFDEFMKRVTAESDLAKLKGAVSGSATARRLQSAGFDPAELGIDAVVHGPGGWLSLAKNLYGKAAKAAVTRGTAREMMPQLMTQGQGAIDQFLEQMAKRQPMVGRGGTTLLPAAAGHVGSLLDF